MSLYQKSGKPLLQKKISPHFDGEYCQTHQSWNHCSLMFTSAGIWHLQSLVYENGCYHLKNKLLVTASPDDYVKKRKTQHTHFAWFRSISYVKVGLWQKKLLLSPALKGFFFLFFSYLLLDKMHTTHCVVPKRLGFCLAINFSSSGYFGEKGHCFYLHQCGNIAADMPRDSLCGYCFYCHTFGICTGLICVAGKYTGATGNYLDGQKGEVQTAWYELYHSTLQHIFLKVIRCGKNSEIGSQRNFLF